MEITLTPHPDIAGRVASCALLQEGIANSKMARGLWERVASMSAAYREQMEGLTPGQIEQLGPGRALYKAVGADPTRRRPASEALLRRILKGRDLYRINTAVDVCNFASLSLLLPIGLYDVDKISGTQVVLRLGEQGEAYKGLGKDQVNLAGHIVLADSLGPFGHPSADSFRTSVDLATKTLLWVLFMPADYPEDQAAHARRFSQETLTEFCGGQGGWLA